MSVYHEPDLSYDRRRTAIFTVVGLLLAIAVIAFLYFVFNPRVNASPLNTSVAAIQSDPGDYLGRRVVLTGKVASVVSPTAFTMVDANTVAGAPILVVSTSPIPPVPGRLGQPGLAPGDPVSVTGPLHRLPRDQKTAGVDVSGPIFDPYRNQPVVYASAVTPPGSAAVVVTPPAVSPIPDRPVYTGQASANDRTVEVRTVRKDPKVMYGQRVQVQNAVVSEVASDRGFWIAGSSPERLFVVLGEGLDEGQVEWMVVVKPGQIVTVNGVITPLPDVSTLQTDWKMTPANAQALAKEQVHLLADGIHIRNP